MSILPNEAKVVLGLFCLYWNMAIKTHGDTTAYGLEIGFSLQKTCATHRPQCGLPHCLMWPA